MYECLFGGPPFNAESPNEIMLKIIYWDVYFHIPVCVPPVNEAVISCLCSMICGAEDRSIQGLKAHPFFDGIDWDNLREQTPPFVPDIVNQLDSKYFPAHENDAQVRAGYESAEKGPSSFDLPYIGFTYRNMESIRL
jgi:hypothetical protein